MLEVPCHPSHQLFDINAGAFVLGVPASGLLWGSVHARGAVAVGNAESFTLIIGVNYGVEGYFFPQ